MLSAPPSPSPAHGSRCCKHLRRCPRPIGATWVSPEGYRLCVPLALVVARAGHPRAAGFLRLGWAPPGQKSRAVFEGKTSYTPDVWACPGFVERYGLGSGYMI